MGAVVRVKPTGRCGYVTHCGRGVSPYRVQYGDGSIARLRKGACREWFKPEDLEPATEEEVEKPRGPSSTTEKIEALTSVPRGQKSSEPQLHASDLDTKGTSALTGQWVRVKATGEYTKIVQDMGKAEPCNPRNFGIIEGGRKHDLDTF